MDTHLESKSPQRHEASGSPHGGPLTGGHPDVLARINDPGVGMTIWERNVPGKMKDWLDALTWDDLPDDRVLIAPDEAAAAVAAMLARSGAPGHLGADMFIADAAETVSRFAEIADCKLVDVRVDAIRHDACWRFHRDFVPLRLITTYLGPGTEYVGRADSERAVQTQKNFDGAVYRVPRFAVSVFTGSQNAEDAGVVHRSPPIAGTGLQRLMLCLNIPSPTSPPRTSL